MSAKTAWRWRRAAPRSGMIDASDRRLPHLRQRPAQPGRDRLQPGSGQSVDRGQRARRARQRPRPRLSSPRSATAASTAGRTAITASHVDTRVKPPRPDLVAKAIKPDYALGPHTASLGLTFQRGRRRSARASPAAPSSASTARGTASRRAATGSSSCPSPAPSRRACRSTSSPASWSTARPMAARSEFRSPATARCSSPTTSAARCGG